MHVYLEKRGREKVQAPQALWECDEGIQRVPRRKVMKHLYWLVPSYRFHILGTTALPVQSNKTGLTHALYLFDLQAPFHVLRSCDYCFAVI